jgi:hypothetical protein
MLGFKPRPDRKYGTAPGDIGVIVIALLFSFAGVWMLVVGGWKSVFTISADALKSPPPAKIQPKPETEMILFPAKK